MEKRQHPREIQPQPINHCGYATEFEGASERFEENVERFLRFIERMVKHVMKACCAECEEALVRGYQIPTGCTNAALGFEVSIHRGIFSEHGHLELPHALTIISIDYPELIKEVEHIRSCAGCALEVTNTWNDL